MRKLFLTGSLIAIIALSFIACEKSDEKETEVILNNGKSTLYNLNTISFDDLKKSKNPYDNNGNEYYFFLQEITTTMKKGEMQENEFVKIIENSNFNFDIKLNEEELSTYKSFFEKRTFNLENLIAFENYIISKDFDFEKKELLTSVSFIKWFSLFSNEISQKATESRGIGDSISSFESCLDRCMRKKLRAVFVEGNWVDQAGFILGTPGSTGWMVASCSWDCW